MGRCDEGCGTIVGCMDTPIERPMKRNDLSRSLDLAALLQVINLAYRVIENLGGRASASEVYG
jgi:hypothetical protein